MRERLLTRHFVDRFLDNDLISPDADRHEILAVLVAGVISSALFVTIVLGTKYLFQPFQSPMWTAVAALDDSFLYVTCSMIVMALVAVAEWDAVALDARDAAILGLLPIPHRVIVRAKLRALGLFAAAFAAALNLAPSVLHPSLVAAKLPMPSIQVAALIGAHAASTIAAGLFGFVSVLGLREAMRAVLGPLMFRRASVFIQGALVVVLVTTLLLLPRLSAGVARSWLQSTDVVTYAVPPLWFVGLHETLGGYLVAELPRGELPAWSLRFETAATGIYRDSEIALRALGRTAVPALALAVLLTLGLYVFNTRRLPTPPERRRRERARWSAMLVRAVQRTLVRRPGAQAGFFFTFQTLSRSVPHRVSLATSLAVGIAAAAIGIGGAAALHDVDVASIPVPFLAAQTVIVIVLMMGFRHAVRVPAELRANWIFHMAWPGDERPYLTGAKRAGVLLVVAPMLLALVPLHALIVGLGAALTHFVYGVLLALVVTESAFLNFRKLPFASTYVPSGTLATRGAVYALLFGAIVYGIAWIERLALGSRGRTLWLFAATGALLVVLRATDLWQRQTRLPVELDELAEPPTQRLGLSS